HDSGLRLSVLTAEPVSACSGFRDVLDLVVQHSWGGSVDHDRGGGSVDPGLAKRVQRYSSKEQRGRAQDYETAVKEQMVGSPEIESGAGRNEVHYSSLPGATAESYTAICWAECPGSPQRSIRPAAAPRCACDRGVLC